MLRSATITLLLLLAAAGGLSAQTGELGVSVTILEPIALTAAPGTATVRHRSGAFVEVTVPLELAGSGSRIVAVTGGAEGVDGSGLRVRAPGGGFVPLTGERAVSLGASGKVGGSSPAEAVYRLELKGKAAPGDLRLTVSYLIAPDA